MIAPKGIPITNITIPVSKTAQKPRIYANFSLIQSFENTKPERVLAAGVINALDNTTMPIIKVIITFAPICCANVQAIGVNTVKSAALCKNCVEMPYKTINTK